MSSIYRKGRDGYFYYQTYVFNPETKKEFGLPKYPVNEAKVSLMETLIDFVQEKNIMIPKWHYWYLHLT